MKFHLPSFFLGFAAGAAFVAARRRLRPLLVEAGAIGYRFVDAVVARVAMGREDLEDVLAEARARARDLQARPEPQAQAS